MDYQVVSLGLLPNEIVIRGGLLLKPVIVSNVSVVAGAHYLVLIKSNPVLCQFLAGQTSCKRPLVKTMVFETLQKARNTKFKELVEEARGASGDLGPGEADDADIEDKLGLDLDVVVSSPTKGKRKVAISRLVAQVPSAAKVSMLGGEWCPMMLMEGSTKAPAIEATPDNLRRLFDMAQAEMEDGIAKRARHGSNSGDRPEPRGPQGRREYVVGNKWVTKIRVEDAAENKGRKFRTLKRRRSDEAETRGKDKAVVGFKRGARKSYTVASGEPMDCLS
jgi:hypothetical protein